MALNFNGIEATEKMYDVVIEEHKWSFNEEMTQKVINFMNALKQEGSTPVSAPVAEVCQEAVKTAYKPVAVLPSNVSCKWKIEETTGFDLNAGKTRRIYRIVDGIFTAGKWMQSKYDANKEYRIPTNQEAHRIATNKVKSLDNIISVDMPGGWKAYGFATKKAAKAAIETLPEMIQGVEIAGYIEKYGKIQAKAVTRVKEA